MKLFPLLICATLGVLVVMAVPSKRPDPPTPKVRDFLCTNNGAEPFLVGDIRTAYTEGRAGAWTIATDGITYYYTPRPGDACTIVEGGL